MLRKPKNVHSQTNRHGRMVYYYRVGHGARVRLPDIDAKNFKHHYDRAAEGRPIDIRELAITPMEARKQRVEAAMMDCLRAARTRSRKKSVPFDLTLDWLLETAEKQDFRCLLTGIEFYAKSGTKGKIDPFAPSLDRIEPSKGYTRANVRIISRAVNTMLLDWGQDVFELVARSYRYWQRTNQDVSIPPPCRIIPSPKKMSG